MLQIEIQNDGLNDEKINKLAIILAAIANSKSLEVVIIEE
jgi:hypothetical protein